MQFSEEHLVILKSAETAAQESGSVYCKCAKVLAMSAKKLNILDDQSNKLIFTEGADNPSHIDDLYTKLIDLIKFGALSGVGNMGDQHNAPADPLFTECCITIVGRNILNENAVT